MQANPQTKHIYGPWSHATRKLCSIHQGKPRGGSPEPDEPPPFPTLASPVLFTSPFLKNMTVSPVALSCREKKKILRKGHPSKKCVAVPEGRTASTEGFEGILWAGNAIIEIEADSWHLRETSGPCLLEIVTRDPHSGAVNVHTASFRHPTISIAGHSGQHPTYITAKQQKGCFFMTHDPTLEFSGNHNPAHGLSLAELWQPDAQLISAKLPNTSPPAHILGGVTATHVFCQSCGKQFEGSAKTVQLAEHMGLRGRLAKIQFFQVQNPCDSE